MDTKVDFKNIWHQQKVTKPNIDELYKRLKKSSNALKLRLVIANLLCFATVIFVLLIWYHFNPELLSTKLGIVITIVAMVLFILSYNKLLPIYSKVEPSLSAKDFVSVLKEIHSKQQYIYTKAIGGYFVLLSTGIALYMYEYIIRMTFVEGSIAYGLVTIWILFNWFYVKPKIAKKQQSHINELIDKFEDIQKQLASF